MKSIVSLALAITASALMACTLWLLWRWFVVPFGTPQIGVMHLFGLSLMVKYFQPRQRKVEGEEWWEAGAYSILNSTIVLGLGALASAFM